jgi:hypothetical protein
MPQHNSDRDAVPTDAGDDARRVARDGDDAESTTGPEGSTAGPASDGPERDGPDQAPAEFANRAARRAHAKGGPKPHTDAKVPVSGRRGAVAQPRQWGNRRRGG